MKSMVAALWRGELCPEMRAGLDNYALQRTEDELERCRKQLADVLNEYQETLLEAYEDCLQRWTTLRDEQMFRDGFGMGVRLTAEGLLNSEKTAQEE